jgi:maltose-binding protein MalE
MNNFIERLKTERMLQIIVVGILVIMIILFFVFKSMFFHKKAKPICYNETIKIWLPFEEDKIYPYLSPFTKFCTQFEIKTKSLEEIKKDLIYALAEGKQPDLVFVDNEFLNQNGDLFSTSTPIFVDSLIAFYNKDVLDFLNLQKPKTLDDLKNFIKKIKDYRQDFYPVALGTKDIRNKKEIILSLMSLDEDYKNKEKLRQNIASALNIYFSFSNPQSEFFSYPEDAGDDLLNFANEKSALYIGFYQDKKEISEINPRLKIAYDIFPLNTFPPKAKIYTKIFYLAQVKKSKSIASRAFVNWFLRYQLKKFSQDFDLVPFNSNINLPEEKKVVLDSAKNFGETFDFLNKEKLFNNLDRVFEVYKDEAELNKVLNQINY